MPKPSEMVVHVRPFKDLAAQARAMGFQLYWDHNESMFEVSVRIEPVTPEAREALIRKTGNPTADGIEATTVYDKGKRKLLDQGLAVPVYDSEEAQKKAIEISTQDTVQYVLRMAQEAIDSTGAEEE